MTLQKSIASTGCALVALMFTAGIVQAATHGLDSHNVASSKRMVPYAAPAPPPGAGDGNLGMTLLGARVNSDGTIALGAGATGGIHIVTGIYEVDFSRDVSACFYSANSFDFGLVATTLEPRSGNVNGVFLEIQSIDGTGTNTDSEFYLTVYCAK